MLFRTYSTLPIVVKPTAHRAFISVAPAMPLKAMAYTLTGFPRLDKWEDRLPEMFDEHDGIFRWSGCCCHHRLRGDSGFGVLADVSYDSGLSSRSLRTVSHEGRVPPSID